MSLPTYRPVLPEPYFPEEKDHKMHGLTREEFRRIGELLGRRPNLTETGVFAAMWSEHCSYKTTRKHLSKFPVTGKRVIQGPGENAGVVDLDDGDAAVFKMESHNHPSFIEPYQGAATGVGGILRDVFTMGARPVALLNALRFGAPEHPKTPHLLAGVTAGIGGYGNCVGVPTVGGECMFHPAYNGNILVNAMAVGLAKADQLFYSAAAHVGSPVLYFGSRTGRDGVNGAVMASDAFSAGSAAKRPAVQVGDPFMEKLVLEACLELMKSGAVLAIQDMGAAGLTCSSLEMASKGGTGVHLTLEKVPLREEGMTPYEIMLSESQERMLASIRPGYEERAAAIFRKWGVDYAVIGVITETPVLLLTVDGVTVAELPVAPLSDQAPVYDRPYTLRRNDTPSAVPSEAPAEAPARAVLALLQTPEGCSKRAISEQYDSQVMCDTVSTGGDAAVVRVHGTRKAMALTAGCNSIYCKADPFEGGKQAVAEAYRNLSATGAEPIAITDCLNFGNPERPEVMGELVGCIEGMAEACRALDFPVVSGNVSLYNDTDGVSVLPTPSVGGVGLLRDVERRAEARFAPDLTVALVGRAGRHLGCSLYARTFAGEAQAAPPTVDLATERRVGEFVRRLIGDEGLRHVHDLSDGGLALAAADMALRGRCGATLSAPEGEGSNLGFWFGEDQARYMIAFPAERLARFAALAREAGIPLTAIGSTGGDVLSLQGDSVTLTEMRHMSEQPLAHLFGLPGGTA